MRYNCSSGNSVLRY